MGYSKFAFFCQYGFMAGLLCGQALVDIAVAQPEQEPASSARYTRYVRGVMKKADVDGDGSIDQQEQQRLGWTVFKNADTNEDGLITAEELLLKVVGANDAESETAVEDVEQDPGSTAGAGLQSFNAPGSYHVTFTLLKLPRGVAEKNYSVQQLLNWAKRTSLDNETGGDNGQPGESKEEILLVDRVEFVASYGFETKISTGGERAVRQSIQQSGRSVTVNQQHRPFGTTVMAMLGRGKDGTITLDYNYSSTLVRNSDVGPDSPVETQLKIDSAMSNAEKNSTVVNVISAGNHFVLVVTSKAHPKAMANVSE